MGPLRNLVSNTLSTYRTKHVFENYGEFSTAEEFIDVLEYARANGLRVYILGNGSNTLFMRKKVKTVVLRNRLARWVNVLDANRVEVSSSTLITSVLKHCENHSLDSFFYLASVPATVGGALAMNAGRGRSENMTIFDFVESITYLESGVEKTIQRENIDLDYRKTMFTGVQDRLILSAILRFDHLEEATGKIRERIQWSKEVQDHSAANCGSVFKEAHHGTLARLRGLRLGKSSYSSKVNNWILTKSSSALSIRALIRFAKIVHILRGKRAVLELIEVD